MKVKSDEDKVIERIIRGERIRRGKEVLDNIEITKEQQATLRDYHKYLEVQGRVFGTREQYLRRVVEFVPYLKGKRFEEVIRKDFSEFFYSKRDKKAATKQRDYVEMHRFYGWLGSDEEDEDRYTKVIKKERYKAPKGERYVIKAEDLPTEEEIQQTIKFAGNPRDKCMIAMSYDLGTRPKELLALNVGDVNFDEYGAVVTVGEHHKTGARTLRLISSLPYLRTWLDSHPYRDEKDKPLFIGLGRNQYGERIEPQTLRWVFKQAAELAGVDKRVYTYLLRHASITREAGNGYGDQQLKVFYGWSPASQMLKVYSHLTSDDVNKKRLQHAGFISDEVPETELLFKQCPRCGEQNPITAEFCNKCSSVLDETKFREQISKEEELKQLRDELNEIKTKENTISGLYAEIAENPELKGMFNALLSSLSEKIAITKGKKPEVIMTVEEALKDGGEHEYVKIRSEEK